VKKKKRNDLAPPTVTRWSFALVGISSREGDRGRYSPVTYVCRGALPDGSVAASVFVVVVAYVVVHVAVHVPVTVVDVASRVPSTIPMRCRSPLEDHSLWTPGEISCYCCCYCCWDY